MIHVTEEKKREYWMWFVADGFLHNRMPHGVTGPRLRKIMPVIWRDEDFWGDVVFRHGGQKATPYEMMLTEGANYEHCRGNFWGMVTQALHVHGML